MNTYILLIPIILYVLVTFIKHISITLVLTKPNKNLNIWMLAFKYHSFTSWAKIAAALQWRHNGRDSISNHQPHDYLLNRLFRPRSNKTSKLRVTGLCAVNSPGTGEFPAQMASNAENVSIWWRHHGSMTIHKTPLYEKLHVQSKFHLKLQITLLIINNDKHWDFGLSRCTWKCERVLLYKPEIDLKISFW